MAKAVSHFCSHCFTYQTTKAPPHIPVPLQPVIASRPWELVAADILKVPLSRHGNQYILVAQDYFSKLPFAMPMPDQKADRIVWILYIFSLVSPPAKLHSDQGHNFESHILAELCKAFKISKTCTTPYHPMGDGLVACMNRTLLSLLRTYTQGRGLGRTPPAVIIHLLHHKTLRHRPFTTWSPFWVQPSFPKLPQTECSSSVWSCELLWSIAEETSWAERTCRSQHSGISREIKAVLPQWRKHQIGSGTKGPCQQSNQRETEPTLDRTMDS